MYGDKTYALWSDFRVCRAFSWNEAAVTQHRPSWAPDDVDIETPSAARMYDFYLGGTHHFPADRALAESALALWPETREMCRANRAFLRRAVTFLARRGVDQFLDLGSGIPAEGNVHEIARAVRPEARTVYVDSDPVAHAHGERLLAHDPLSTYLRGDLREPEDVLARAASEGRLNLGRPVAVLMLMTLHFVPDTDDPGRIVESYRKALAPGSFLVMSHGTSEYRPAETGGITGVYSHASHGIVPRDRNRIRELISGWELADPGLVDVIHWRPEPRELAADPLGGDVARYSTLVAVGRNRS